MKLPTISRLLLTTGLFFALAAGAQTVVFTVHPTPAAKNFHVTMKVGGVSAGFQDFEMPSWMPGYYRLQNYAQYVSNFHAQDATGHDLGWEKVTPHTWRVVTAAASSVALSYDVAATRAFAASNSIADDRAFIAPPGMFLYLPGHLDRPATVTVHLPAAWHEVATGLAPVAGEPDTFSAPNFDVLIDSPMLLGNQEQLHFAVRGVPHTIALEDVPPTVDRAKMAADLQRMVSAATDLMGAVPYDRYTFLMMGRGNGGIEHLNSAAIEFNGQQMGTPDQYQRWLSYVAHEYFHNFNVKRIRPLALGPFDYQTENLTNMLWVSEGLTVYYEDLLLVRAGLMTPAEYLQTMQSAITKFEAEPGRPYQSATESSLTTWGTSGVGGDRNTTISYYDNGGILGAMLDLAIRHDSHDAHSLDDVMRVLYRTYYVQDKRGFTDAEFQAECERAAGEPLPEIFRYASTTAPMDYKKFFAYAGVDVSETPQPAKGGYIGLDTDSIPLPPGSAPAFVPPPGAGRGGGRGPQPPTAALVVTAVAAGSPAEQAGIHSGDQILALNAAPATTQALSNLVTQGKTGDTIDVIFGSAANHQEAKVTLASNQDWTFQLQPAAKPDAGASAILASWLRTKQ